MPHHLAEAIDNILPQTQCGLCGYKGCRPYAEAIAAQTDSIDRCPPGGVTTLLALAKLTQCDPAPYMAQMQKKALPPQLAVIREDQCIGCTKCIQACPVDAIIGAAQQMHSVFIEECTGCGLCLPPCPVDCIDLITLTTLPKPSKAKLARARFLARNERLAAKTKAKKPCVSPKNIAQYPDQQPQMAAISTQQIQEAIARVRIKKAQKHDPQKTY